MAATRRLQMEIERTLKKVQTSLEEFDITWKKMDEALDATKRDKFEGELKKELKRLQRDRDQIRTWLATQEAKAFQEDLEAARRQIEFEMERFKQFEKASKIKAFSKEGLVQQPKVDPQEQAKADAANFLNKILDSLQLLVDDCEADVERLTSGRSTKKVPAQVLNLEVQIQKHKWHRTKLEQVHRLLENDEITPEDVDGIRESLEYYIDQHQKKEIDEAIDDSIYDDMPFHKLDHKVGEELSVVHSGALT